MKYVIFFPITTKWEKFHRRNLFLNLAKNLEGRGVLVGLKRPFTPLVGSIKRREVLVELLKAKSFFNIQQQKENLYLVDFFLPIHEKVGFFFKPVYELLKFHYRLIVEKIIQNLPYDFLVKGVWINRPLQKILWESFDFDLKIYDIYDDYRYKFDGSINVFEWIHEPSILKSSDVVFVVSRNLYKIKSPFNKNTHYIQTGTDIKKFDNTKLPLHIKKWILSIKEPRIAYLGYVRRWIDFDLIKWVIKKRPEWNFVFFGSFWEGDEEFIRKITRNVKNIHFFGFIDYKYANQALKMCHAGIIPWQVNRFTINSCPYKLFDYLGANLEVVGTDLPELYEFEKYVYPSKTKEDFLKNLEAVIKRKEKIKVEVPLSWTWENRTQQMVTIIEKTINQKFSRI